jgi:lipid II:glycine glycyltransferase (peptidoglycan interpeptide bridge formation enzyme)
MVEGGKINGILPIMYIEGKYGRVYNSLPFYGSNGGIITSKKEVFQALVKKYNEIINGGEVASSTIVANPLLEQDYPGLCYDFTDIRIGLFNGLQFGNSAEKELLASIDSSARRNIRKAEKSGVMVEIDNDQMEFLKETHRENMATIGGKAKEDSFFNLISKYFAPGEDFNIYVAKKDGRPISAILLFYYNKTVEYFTPVIKHEYRNIQPLALILFKAILDAHNKGYELWNWGGTWVTQGGVFKFKKKWGGEEKNYTYYIKINNPKLYKLSKEEILKEYPNFFVIPFDKLKN